MTSMEKAPNKNKVTTRSQGLLEEAGATTSRIKKNKNVGQSNEAIRRSPRLKQAIIMDPSTYSSIKRKLFTPKMTKGGSSQAEIAVKRQRQESSCSEKNSMNENKVPDALSTPSAEMVKRQKQEYSCSKKNNMNEKKAPDALCTPNVEMGSRHSPRGLHVNKSASVHEVEKHSLDDHARFSPRCLQVNNSESMKEVNHDSQADHASLKRSPQRLQVNNLKSVHEVNEGSQAGSACLRHSPRRFQANESSSMHEVNQGSQVEHACLRHSPRCLQANISQPMHEVNQGLRRSPRRLQANNSPSVHALQDVSQANRASVIGYNTTNRRRKRGLVPKNEKGRGCNKTKVLKKPEFVDVNERLQPISASGRQLSTLLGCLARDPRRLPLNCWDWRNMEKKYIHSIWEEAKRSYYFPKDQEPYAWALETIHDCWRGHKSELKVAYFDGKTHNEAISNRPKEIPEDMWLEMVTFWESAKGKERSERGVQNRSKLKMCSYSGSKSFERVRAEVKEKTGKEPDELGVWLITHEPKQGSKLDDASTASKKMIEEELSSHPSPDASIRREIFKKVVGEDTNGYAKTYGRGVKVPRSRKKRSAYEEERAKRIKSEAKVDRLEGRVGYLTDLVKKLLENQGILFDDYQDENLEDVDDVEAVEQHEDDEVDDDEVDDDEV